MESTVTPAPSRSTRPHISWPKVRSCGLAPYVSFISPRQMCRSEPHTPARVSFTRMAPGSTSGTGYSRRSNSPPYARSTAMRPFMIVLLWSRSARGEHHRVQRNSHRRIAQLRGHRRRRGLLHLFEGVCPPLYDGRRDGIPLDQADGRLGRRWGRPVPRDVAHLDAREARLAEPLPHRCRIVQAVGDAVEIRWIGGEEAGRRLVGDARGGILRQDIPHVEEILPTGLEHPKSLADPRRLVGEEHEPELADGRVERLIRKGQPCGI